MDNKIHGKVIPNRAWSIIKPKLYTPLKDEKLIQEIKLKYNSKNDWNLEKIDEFTNQIRNYIGTYTGWVGGKEKIYNNNKYLYYMKKVADFKAFATLIQMIEDYPSNIMMNRWKECQMYYLEKFKLYIVEELKDDDLAIWMKLNYNVVIGKLYYELNKKMEKIS